MVGQSQGSLRSLDISEPTYVGGIPTHSKSQNVSRMAANLGMGPLRGNVSFLKWRLRMRFCSRKVLTLPAIAIYKKEFVSPSDMIWSFSLKGAYKYQTGS